LRLGLDVTRRFRETAPRKGGHEGGARPGGPDLTGAMGSGSVRVADSAAHRLGASGPCFLSLR